ncbi:PqiB family protein [Methylococcus capsulatus]|jgi:paraquat-inducible protein B|uniref:Paraquat-inducible protein B n=1 Tax=Methylococcus capsulatus (strain ATCC 33009 / NCIMB 11132 / Bath) TaxID=243233 RepID=Q60BV2_METCA|nr:MlaD family protein [Methylococcus capsulatus]AAU90524.1 paraquat-inducible protein B [Methylococcus capsulatus str. Bath]QXP89816.1 MCE family protein [Methylococcus capsulatus]
MNESPKEGAGGAPDYDVWEAEVKSSRGLPLVWLIPLVALGIGIWLAYRTLSEEGPTITLLFKEAPGLEAGKSKIKFKDVEIGTVESVVLNEDLTGVVVTAKMEKHVATHLGENTAFWVVKPELGLGGVSGLDTLMAGNYIAVEFGGGKVVRRFVGLERPPRIKADTPGRSFFLSADNAGPLKYGTPVYFRDIEVGQVVNVGLAEDNRSVQVEIFIDAPYHRLVHNSTRFWQVSGIDLSLSAQGVNLKVGSIMSLLQGGITFETPTLNDPKVQSSEPNTRFRLHKDFASIAEGTYTLRQPYLLFFDDSVRGLNVGAPVELKGIRVGTVTELKLALDFGAHKIRIPVVIEIDPERLIPYGAEEIIERAKKEYKAAMEAGRRPFMEKLVERGLRARLRTGNLLTGQLYVDLDFYPESPPKSLDYSGQYPELPTLPSVADELQRNVTEIIANLKKIPLDKIGQELLGTVQGSNRLLNSPELKGAVGSLNLALKDLRHLAQTADREMVTLTSAAEKSLSSTARVLEQLEPGSAMAVDISNALEELAASARSIRALTDYLERHPEALLHGKGGSGGKP